MDHDLGTNGFPDNDGRRERARRTVASYATGPDDLAALLDALDLHSDQDTELSARTCSVEYLHTFNNR